MQAPKISDYIVVGLRIFYDATAVLEIYKMKEANYSLIHSIITSAKTQQQRIALLKADTSQYILQALDKYKNIFVLI